MPAMSNRAGKLLLAGLLSSILIASFTHRTAQAKLNSILPVRLHPKNPHYFEFRGKAVALITSGEHYGAVLNGAFDYRRYLDTLAADGLNFTRLFGGSYIEVPGQSFGIRRNDLAPEPGRFIAPWARRGDKFDLDKWNPE